MQQSENELKNVIRELDTDTCQTLQKASMSQHVKIPRGSFQSRSLYQTSGPCIFQHRAPQEINAKLGEAGSEMLDVS